MRRTLRIFKYELEITDQQTVTMPEGAVILHVGKQDGRLKLWALVDRFANRVVRTIFIHGTGHVVVMPDSYIGTVPMDGLVWHVFDGGESYT